MFRLAVVLAVLALVLVSFPVATPAAAHPAEGFGNVVLLQSRVPSSMTLVLNPSPSYFGQSVTITATVTDLLGGNGTPTGTVEFFDDGISLGTAALIGDSATLVTSFTRQCFCVAHVVSAIYSGDSVFDGTFWSVSHQVIPLPTMTTVVSDVNPSVVGQPVTYTATVTATNGGGNPTGGVIFSSFFASFLAPLDSNGVAVYTTTYTRTLSDSLTATYEGDATFASSSSASMAQVVNPASTSMTLTSSVNPSSAGEPIIFTAQVTTTPPGSGTPWGCVTFSVDGNFLGEACLDLNGVATIGPWGGLTPGEHTIDASLRENSDFHSSAATLRQVVQQPPVQDDIQHIINTVNGMSIHHGTQNSLTAKLQAALGAVDRGNSNAASNDLSAFVHEVEAQRGKKITDADANGLIALANTVITRLGG